MSTKYQVVPTKLPYLHPSQRNLKSEQIGPSSHKNEYTIGVLQGNWIEERAGFEQKFVDAPLESISVAKASYQNPAKLQQLAAATTSDLEKELIFGHGHDFHQTSFVTTNQLFYKDPNSGGDSLKTDTVMKMTGASAVNEKAMAKRQQWQAEAAPNHYETTKAATIDSTGRSIQHSKVEFNKPATSKWGDCVKSLTNDHHRTGFRQPVALKRTPLR